MFKVKVTNIVLGEYYQFEAQNEGRKMTFEQVVIELKKGKKLNDPINTI